VPGHSGSLASGRRLSFCREETPIFQLDPLSLLVRRAGFVVAISVHEFSHAQAAYSLGDSTADRMGRRTLNPLRHLDPFGSLLLLIAGFGWGKPVPVDPRALRYGRLGMAIVSAAGPASNLVTAFVTALIAIGAFPTREAMAAHPTLFEFLISLALLNVGLCVFNLIPLPPLDGFGVAVGVLPWAIAAPLARLARYGPGILLILFFLPTIIRVDVLGFVLVPAQRFLFSGIVDAASFILRAVGVG
jgi:Zn-dependent protease